MRQLTFADIEIKESPALAGCRACLGTLNIILQQVDLEWDRLDRQGLSANEINKEIFPVYFVERELDSYSALRNAIKEVEGSIKSLLDKK